MRTYLDRFRRILGGALGDQLDYGRLDVFGTLEKMERTQRAVVQAHSHVEPVAHFRRLKDRRHYSTFSGCAALARRRSLSKATHPVHSTT